MREISEDEKKLTEEMKQQADKAEAFGDKEQKEKPFHEWSKAEKQTATIMMGNKKMPIMKALSITAKMLDQNFKCTNQETGEPVDHYVILTKLWMKKGKPALDEYLAQFEPNGETKQVKIEL